MQDFKEFIITNYSLLTRIVEAIPVIVGLILFDKFKKTKVKYFIYYLIYVFIGELIAYYPSYLHTDLFKPLDNLISGTVFKRNYWWYTFFWHIGNTVFIVFYFLKSISTHWSRKLIKLSTACFLLSCCFYFMFFWSSLLNSSSYFINLFSLLIKLLVLILFFIEVLKNNEYIDFSKSIDFYIAWIFFFWWLVTTPLIFFNDYFNALDKEYTYLQWYIKLSANVFMYIGFSILLIACKPPKFQGYKLS